MNEDNKNQAQNNQSPNQEVPKPNLENVEPTSSVEEGFTTKDLLPALIVGAVLAIVLAVRIFGNNEDTEAKEIPAGQESAFTKEIEKEEEPMTEEVVEEENMETNDEEKKEDSEEMGEDEEKGGLFSWGKKDKEEESLKIGNYSDKVNVYPEGSETSKRLLTACSYPRNEAICAEEFRKITKTIQKNTESEGAKLKVVAGSYDSKGELISLRPTDSIYVYFKDRTNGGHLLRGMAENYGTTEEGLTEVVFDLSELPLVNLPYSDDKKPAKTLDIFGTILSKMDSPTAAFISSPHGGMIKEFTIMYK